MKITDKQLEFLERVNRFHKGDKRTLLRLRMVYGVLNKKERRIFKQQHLEMELQKHKKTLSII